LQRQRQRSTLCGFAGFVLGLVTILTSCFVLMPPFPVY
jgi:hypothetical protein